MKLATILLLFTCLTSFAAGFSQTVTLKEKNVPLEKIFKEVRKQTGYRFLYTKEMIQKSKPVSINATAWPLDKILSHCFQEQPLRYQIIEKTIIVKMGLHRGTPHVSTITPLENIPAPQLLSVTGYVADSTGNPLQGVSVMEKGTTNGTVTDNKGFFKLDVRNGNAVLVISRVGYFPREVAVSNRTSLNITLINEFTVAEDIMVVGYGSVRKKDLTGAASSVNEETIKQTPPTTLENAIQGRMAGVTVTNTSAEPGGGIKINVRGITSLSGGNQPLYVIDGIPMFNDYGNSSAEFEGNVPTNFLAGLNPADIQSIDVLKDASATAIYGSRGANGVIMVTTKKGSMGKAKIELNHYTTLNQAPKPIPLANAKEYALFFNELLTNSGQEALYDGSYVKSGDNMDSIYFPAPAELGEGTNWQREIFRNALTQNYQLTVSGGNPGIQYLVSGNYLDENGVVDKSRYQRGSFRSNLNIKASDRLTLKINMNMSSDVNNRALNANSRGLAGGFERTGVILKSYTANPVWSKDNLYDRVQSNFSNTNFYLTMLNPINDIDNTINQRKVTAVLANLDMIYRFSNTLNLTVRGGYNRSEAATDMFWGLKSQLGYLRGQKTFQTTWNTSSYLNENFLTYSKSVKSLSINVVGGVSWQKRIRTGSQLGGENLSVPTDNGLYLLPLYENRDIPVTDRVDDVLLSAYGRINLSYKNRYLLTFTNRGDGSSRFAENKKWAYFPSAGIGWNFGDERFLSGRPEIFSSGKIRMSYGVSGNQSIAAYQSLSTLSPISIGFINSGITGLTSQRTGNADLTWETTSQHDIGLELGFLKDRLKLNVDVYRKQTDNLLQSKLIPSSSGYSSILSNFGSIENKGLEVELAARVVDKSKLGWDVAFNIAANRTKVLDLGDDIKFYNYSSGASGGADYTHRITVGGPIGVFWGFKTDGLLTADDIANKYPKLLATMGEGSIKYVDVNGDSLINDNDRTEIGRALPKYTLGLNNTLTYGNFSFNVFMNAVMGHQLLNQNLLMSEYGTTRGIPSARYIADYWSENNKDAKYPRPLLTNPNYQTTDRLIEDGSYLRVKTVSLRYRFTNPVKGIAGAVVYLSANNLYTFTKYTGYDPEVSAYGQNEFLNGIDFGSYPRTRSWTIGIDLSF